MSRPGYRKKVGLLRYGMGNAGSVGAALEWLGGRWFASEDLTELSRADAFVLPGVGAFAAAMGNLERTGMLDLLRKEVHERGKPFLGICLGMQLLAEDSNEMGSTAGFSWLKGHVVALEPGEPLKVPHVGWNEVSFGADQPMFRRIDPGSHFFFDHSFCLPEAVSEAVAWCDYGIRFTAATCRDNLWATQFHPEKSQRNGLKLLRNFLDFAEDWA